MSDDLPTVWPAEPHTQAKHAILKSYLDAWMPILSSEAAKPGRQKRKLRFVDGFAGPGIYEGNEPGSPILAIQAAIQHSKTFPAAIHFLFIELDRDRFNVLNQQLALVRPQIAQSPNVVLEEPQLGSCVDVLTKELALHDPIRSPFGPALVFLDQFGYSEVPMLLINAILRHGQCEVFTYLEYKHLNRFLTDAAKDAARTAAFGDESWRIGLDLSGSERAQKLLQTYKQALKSHGGAKFVWDFAMVDERNLPIYWLFFCTNNIRGLEEMKRAMLRVDDKATFAYSDSSDPGQLSLLKMFDNHSLAKCLCKKFAGQTVTIGKIKEYVLTDTPLVKYASTLQELEREKKMKPLLPPGKARVAYTADLQAEVRFENEFLF